MTHFPNADTTDSDALGTELAGFERATETFLKQGLRPEHRHAANSAAVFRGNACFDLVRPGIALYGVSPFGQAKPVGLSTEAETSLDRLRPVMSVSSRIVALRTLKLGDAVGYGSTWQANRPAVIATVPMGYADGLSRGLSNRGHLLVRGVQAPIVGAVSMDMTTVDVTDVDGVQLNDEVVLLGSGVVPLRKPGAEAPTLSAVAVARASGTIAWEVLTNISRRVPRFYLGA
jgi:alanine racemase